MSYYAPRWISSGQLGCSEIQYMQFFLLGTEGGGNPMGY